MTKNFSSFLCCICMYDICILCILIHDICILICVYCIRPTQVNSMCIKAFSLLLKTSKIRKSQNFLEWTKQLDRISKICGSLYVTMHNFVT